MIFFHAEKEISACKAEQIYKMTPIFTQNNNLSENSCQFCEFAQFSKQSFARLKSKHFSRFFWSEVNLRGLRAFILQNVQGSVVETEKKVLPPITQLGKEETLIILLSA